MKKMFLGILTIVSTQSIFCQDKLDKTELKRQLNETLGSMELDKFTSLYLENRGTLNFLDKTEIKLNWLREVNKRFIELDGRRAKNNRALKIYGYVGMIAGGLLVLGSKKPLGLILIAAGFAANHLRISDEEINKIVEKMNQDEKYNKLMSIAYTCSWHKLYN